MKTISYSFSSVRLAILSGASSPEDHHLLKIELQPKNMVDNYDIFNFCFYLNKSFGIFSEDLIKLTKQLKRKGLNFTLNKDNLKVLENFYIVKFQSGKDLIDYFQNINMNSTNDRPRITDNQILRENTITSISELKNLLSKKNPSILCLDIEIQNNKNEIFEPSECGFVYFDGIKEEYKHYLVKEFYQLKTGNSSALQKKFSFGKTEIVTFNEFIEIIKDYLQRTDLFVAHSVNSENHYLSRMGISLPYEVDYIVDTQLIYKEYDPKNIKPISLIDLLNNLNIKNKDLHNAGNDAVYTWKAFNHMIK
jgi:hypothetical protein